MGVRLYSLFGLFLICPAYRTLDQALLPYIERQLESYTDQFCSGTACGKYSYSYIYRRFSGIFFTKKQFEAKQLRFNSVRQKYLANQGVDTSGLLGDGDSCCPTDKQTFANTTMENIYGKTKYIVHMPPNYQFIPHGFCLEKGTCDGLCVIEPVTHTLLTYNPYKGALEFDQFVVPGYCSCKAQ